MITRIKYTRSHVSPCGINCAACAGYMREKNKCDGCWSENGSKPNYCKTCSIKNCESLKNTESKFCYECEKFPCKRMRQLDKRYRLKYHTTLIDDLVLIKEKGIDEFLSYETLRRTCPECGAGLCIHKDHCLNCSLKLY